MPEKPEKPVKPATCHASARGIEASNGKACPTKDRARPQKPGKAHQDDGRHHGPNAGRAADGRGRQPATIEAKRRGAKSSRRLRVGRRPR